MILIVNEGGEIARKYGLGSAVRTLTKGLDSIGREWTFDWEKPFDVIVANDYESGVKGVELKKKSGKKLIASIHLSHADMRGEALLMENCDGVLVYSEMMRDEILKTYPDLKVPVYVVILGIDTDLWFPDDTPREDFVLMVGRSSAPNKNIAHTIKKCLFEGVQFKIAGDSDARQEYSFGYLEPEELAKIYRRARLLIFPSLFDPFGLAALEALACGCPIAVSTKAGVSEIVNEHNAILFDPLQDFSVKAFLSKSFDSLDVSDHAKQFDHVRHAHEFVQAVDKIVAGNSLAAIESEIARGDYDRYPVAGKVVLDLGAYYGESACYFAEKGAKRVYAVEPFSSFNLIAANAKQRGVGHIVWPRQFALGPVDSVIEIDPDYVNNGEDRLWEHQKKGGQKIAVMSLDTLLSCIEDKDVVVKMDIEGSEDSILAIKNPETFSKVKHWMIEVHHKIRRDIAKRLAIFLYEHGYRGELHQRGPNVSMMYAERR